MSNFIMMPLKTVSFQETKQENDINFKYKIDRLLNTYFDKLLFSSDLKLGSFNFSKLIVRGSFGRSKTIRTTSLFKNMSLVFYKSFVMNVRIISSDVKCMFFNKSIFDIIDLSAVYESKCYFNSARSGSPSHISKTSLPKKLKGFELKYINNMWTKNIYRSMAKVRELISICEDAKELKTKGK